MGRRQTLDEDLRKTPGIEKVYFQPPASLSMVYPCIRYSRDNARIFKADNQGYRFVQRYLLTVITRDPDSEVPEYLVAHFPMCSIDRYYTVDNLYHIVLTLYH